MYSTNTEFIDFNKVCRCCLEEKQKLIYLNEKVNVENNKYVDIEIMLLNCVYIQVIWIIIVCDRS